MSPVARVDDEVYQTLMDVRVRLESATNRPVSFSQAIKFIMKVREIAGTEP